MNKLAPAKTTMSVNEVAEMLNVSTWTIYDMVRRKEIPHSRVRTRIIFRLDTINNWMTEQEKASFSN